MSLLTSLFTGITTFSLQDLEGFPYNDYVELQELYGVLQNWYDGVPLAAVTTDQKTGKVIEKYPIKINPIKGTCHKHAATVVGQNVDSIRFGGLPFQIIPDVEKDEQTKADTIKKALMKVFIENQLGASFLSNSIISQYLGGSIVSAKWLPGENRIEISTPNPKEFYGIPDGTNYWRLREAWIIKEITTSDAIAYGYKPKQGEDKFYYTEHWTKKEYEIMVNGITVKFPDSDLPQKGINPFGVVPIVYIPHIRVSGFIGDSIITDTVKGVIKELNLRMADIGDAVSDDAHGYVAVRHIRGSIQTVNVGDGRPVLNLGGGTGIGNEASPDMFSINTKSASEPMTKFASDLYQIYRREVNHPAVADGEDEGSQRSSLTLSVRMAPLVSEADMERTFFSVGMSEFARILLIMMADKGLESITKEMIDTPFIVQWLSMLPRDREALTNEAAVRSKNKLGSQEHLMGLFGDIQNVEEEMEKIADEKETFAPPVSQFGNAGTGGAKPVPLGGKAQTPKEPE